MKPGASEARPAAHNGTVTTPDDQPGPPSFAGTLSRAIQARGLSLERIRARLDAAGVPVSIATLSYWQSGRSFPTRSSSYLTLVELERILNLESGDLTALTHTSDGRLRRELFEWQKVLPSRDIAEQIIADLGIEMEGQFARVTACDTVIVARDRTLTSQLTRLVRRAERSGVRNFALVVEQDGPSDEPPGIEPLFGCALGEVVSVPERLLTVAELTLPRPLQRGELHFTEYLVAWPATGTPSDRVERSCPEPMKGLVMGVQFHPEALPARVEARVRATIDAVDHDEVVPVALTDTGEAQFTRTDVRPGVYGLYWSWD